MSTCRPESGVDALEQGGGDGVLFQDDFRRVLLNQFLEFGRIADINQAEVVFGIGAFKPQFAGTALDIAQMQTAAGGRVEEALKAIRI
jgi:hypothetical protein